MPNLTTTYNAEELCEELTKEELLDKSNDISKYITAIHKNKIPIYTYILFGIGSFLLIMSTLLLLIDLQLINFNNYISLFILSFIFIIIPIPLYTSYTGDKNAKFGGFIMISTSMIAIGKILFASAFLSLIGESWAIPLALFIITAATYSIYAMPLDRFFSAFFTLISLFIYILVDKEIDHFREFFLNGFMLFHFCSTILLFNYSKRKPNLVPLFHSFVFSLCMIMLIYASNIESKIYGLDRIPVYFTNIVSIMNMVGYIAIMIYLAKGIKNLIKEPFIIAIIAMMLLSIAANTYFIFAISLLILGHNEKDKILITLGAILSPITLFLYYFNLPVSHLDKSIFLLSSGLIFLAGRAYLVIKSRINKQKA